MGRPKRQYPLGKYRLRAPKDAEKDKAYPVELEYYNSANKYRELYSIIRFSFYTFVIQLAF